jgi:multimeric flavodoxin WrbA
MAKILVLYYSAYGHIETIANAVAAGAREAGAQVEHLQQRSKAALSSCKSAGACIMSTARRMCSAYLCSSFPTLIM